MGYLGYRLLPWKEPMKSQQAQLCSAIGHLHGTGRTQEQPSELLETKTATLSYLRKLSGIDQAAGKRI